MTGRLKSWHEPGQMASGHGMGDGMIRNDDMKKLDTAHGTEATKLF